MEAGATKAGGSGTHASNVTLADGKESPHKSTDLPSPKATDITFASSSVVSTEISTNATGTTESLSTVASAAPKSTASTPASAETSGSSSKGDAVLNNKTKDASLPHSRINATSAVPSNASTEPNSTEVNTMPVSIKAEAVSGTNESALPTNTTLDEASHPTVAKEGDSSKEVNVSSAAPNPERAPSAPTDPQPPEERKPLPTGSKLFAKNPYQDPSLNTPYCTLTNPEPSEDVVCIAGNPDAAEQFVVVVTVTEEELLRSVNASWEDEHTILGNQIDGTMKHQIGLSTKRPGDKHALSFLDDLPLKKHIYVKSNWTTSYRRNNATWDPRLQEKLAMERMVWETDATPESHGPWRDKVAPTHVFRSIAHDLLKDDLSVLSIVELPNIGDEALPMLWHLANRVHGNTTAGLLPGRKQPLNGAVPEFTVFLHGHAESWHSVDVVREQLPCLCMNRKLERYRTLTYGEKAFLLQCVPMQDPNITDLPNRTALERMEARMQRHIANFTKQFRFEWKMLLEDEMGPPPKAIMRDCCATVVLHRDAILGRSAKFYKHLYNITRFQPYEPFMEQGYEREISLFLERLWRTIFNATYTDFIRDFGNIKCTHAAVQRQWTKQRSTGQHDRDFPLFDCPPKVYLRNESEIPEPYRSRKCPAPHRNIFQ